jgi:dimeric dUTPase (all-alpha-NTP-PPase superfamily)
MEEIFELQWQLGAHILRNIGLDYGETLSDPEKSIVWIENHRKALSAELAELIREVNAYGLGTSNGRVEIVDMLHFLVSLSHLVHVVPADIPFHRKGLEESDGSAGPGHEIAPEDAFQACALRAFLTLDALQNSLKWKWWAKGGGFKPEKAREAVLAFWSCFYEFCAIFHMDFATVKKIYLEKNRINFIRQDQNYNEDTKTEADNEALGV